MKLSTSAKRQHCSSAFSTNSWYWDDWGEYTLLRFVGTDSLITDDWNLPAVSSEIKIDGDIESGDTEDSTAFLFRRDADALLEGDTGVAGIMHEVAVAGGGNAFTGAVATSSSESVPESVSVIYLFYAVVQNALIRFRKLLHQR